MDKKRIVQAAIVSAALIPGRDLCGCRSSHDSTADIVRETWKRPCADVGRSTSDQGFAPGGASSAGATVFAASRVSK